MNRKSMPVAPEALLMTFSLAQVTSFVIAWEDETMTECSSLLRSDEETSTDHARPTTPVAAKVA